MNPTLFDENPALQTIAHKLLAARQEGQLLIQSGDAGFASAPSNIALLKYWGKMPGHWQIPVNSSLSLSLGSFRAQTQVRAVGRFFPLVDGQAPSAEFRPPFTLELNNEQQPMPAKMEQFLRHLLTPFASDIALSVKSENNFPTACGVASSAAGFAALVAAVADLLNLQRFLSAEELQLWLTEWARLGSGSATRSAIAVSMSDSHAVHSKNQFVAWCLNKTVADVQTAAVSTSTLNCDVHERFHALRHCVLVLDASEKKIGSSEGHMLADTSLLQQIRLAYYPHRFDDFSMALRQGDFSVVAQLTEQDAFEMHAVMGTGSMPLHYMNAQTAAAIRAFIEQRHHDSSAMFWTLDAGANPHLLFDISAAESLARVFATLAAHPDFTSARVLLGGERAPNGLLVGRKSLTEFGLLDADGRTQKSLLWEFNLRDAAEFLRS